MPHFCEVCGSLMVANTQEGRLQMECLHCLRFEPPVDADFLRFHVPLGVVDDQLKYDVLLENAPHDPAGKLVRRACPECGEPLLTLVYVGEAMRPVFCCLCGARLSLEQLEAAEGERAAAGAPGDGGASDGDGGAFDGARAAAPAAARKKTRAKKEPS